jgi:transcriptional regulator GlxA family with amidase domain
LKVVADRALASIRGAIDTLVVVGGEGAERAATDPELVAWVERAARRSRRVASVCTGAFVLAAAGLLDGKRATTHWRSCGQLAREYPDVLVEPDPIFVRDGNVWTSAGVTAGMDLALALVDDDLGRDVALMTARQLVMFVQRPGGQSQFSAQLGAQLATRDPLRDLQQWIADNPDEDHAVERLAGRVAMSPRHFARVFRDEIGCTPAAYVERVRVEVARRLLESTALPGPDVARAAGFGTTETLRRAFARRVGVGPSEYRDRFRPSRAS